MLFAMAGRWLSARAQTGGAKRKLLVVLVAVVALVLFAPTIALYSPLRQQILTTAVPPSVGALSVGNLSIGWITPLSATNVTLLDPEGNRLAQIERLTIDRTVIGFAVDSSDLGTIRLENATIYALARGDGSNIEDAIARAVLAASDKPSDLGSESRGPDYKLEIVGGQILSRDAATGETWSVESLAATVTHPARGPMQVEATGLVRPAPAAVGGASAPAGTTNAGRFELHWGAGPVQDTDGARLVCQDLPMAALAPWLRRIDSQMALTGVLTGDMAVTYPKEKYDSLSGETTGRISLANFAVTSTALAGDTLSVEDTKLAWKCTASGGRVSVENLSLASDVAMFDLLGTFDERLVRGVAAGKNHWHDLATGGDLQVEGKVNLARLAQRLPNLFKVREGTTITSGQIQFTARTMAQDTGHQVTASLNTTPLAGTTRGRAIEWDAPLDIDLVARHTHDGWRFDNLTCRSEFLQVSGSGDARRMDVTGQVDLDELTSRLDQFVDLTDWQLAGRGEVTARCSRDTTGEFVADASGKLNDFVIAYRGGQIIVEPQLEWKLKAMGASASNAIWPNRLSGAQLILSGAGDKLDLKLTQPTLLEETWVATDWPVSITSSGRLDGWARRLRPWIDLSAWNTAGQLELSARGRVRATPLVVSIAESSATIVGLRAASTEWLVDEPKVQWSGDIAWDSTTSTLVSQSGQLVSSTVSASFRDWFWTADPQQTNRVGGLAAVRMNLGRLARAQRLPAGEQRRIQPLGEISGNVKLAAQSGQVVAAVDLGGQNIEVQKPQPALPGAPPTMQTIWREPTLRVVGTVSYAPQQDRVKFDGLQTQSSTLTIAASGSIDGVSTSQMVNLAGTVDYDLASLSPILAQYVGEGLSVVGREQAKFEFKGPLAQVASGQALAVQPSGTGGASPATITQVSAVSGGVASWYGRVLAPWQSASFYGLPIGQGRISAELKSGQVIIEPLDLAVSGGRLTFAPSIRLVPAPGEVTLPAGPLLTNIHITPDVSNRMLKYIVPYIASATQTEGMFSLTLTGGRVPLGSPDKSDIAGRLDVKSVRVVPGPSIAELGALASEIERVVKGRGLLGAVGGGGQSEPFTLLSVSDRSLDFRMVDGRIYHQGLEFQIGKLVLRSRGSVGLDETVSAMLEVEIPSEGRLRNIGITKIEVPVTGTLGSIRIDKSAAVQSLVQQLGGQFLNEESIGNALDKLFGGDR
ncbi:hypothetical protein NG895_21515 [Aeoliella sp. ICT_H6.2]|uniref:Uncharacterized protein n=1 Tax=Aeoliella straminimaris TaxID=2954799 RepID=A0A9X2FIX7_9BACT|nr:hypothetical protein [Aeoliella straminimaris]MCO6046486.1 hypothetical protein [Aeoliella straminimaris]